MRSFKDIQESLGKLPPHIKKIYLLGSTGAGKTSLVRYVIGTEKYAFPTTAQTRTTISNTEYAISSALDYKTTILFRKEDDIRFSVEELVQEAIRKGVEKGGSKQDIALRLEESSDERFRLKYIISTTSIEHWAKEIFDTLAKINNQDNNNKDIDTEELFSINEVREVEQAVINSFMYEIDEHFREIIQSDDNLFSVNQHFIQGFNNKEEFILENKRLLKSEYPSILPLVEYIRIEGDLASDWVNSSQAFVLIDGEGIGHSLREKRDTLSARHYDHFSFCNSILLVEKGDDPFISGGQAAIESILLNGYRAKLRLVFSKTDRIENADKNGFIRRRLDNLRSALLDKDIIFQLDNKETYKLEKLNEPNIKASAKSEINRLINDIQNQKESEPKALEYDFFNFLAQLDPGEIIREFSEGINKEHWTVVKALTRRLLNSETEYKHLKPLSLILIFIMRDINVFLRRSDDLDAAISFSQNFIKQKFSVRLIMHIYENFILGKKHLWKRAFEESGAGSHARRKKIIVDEIFKSYLPERGTESFNEFRLQVKDLLMKSGAQEVAPAKKTYVSSVLIEGIYGTRKIQWHMSRSVNILLGKNGSGKSTVIRSIYDGLNKNSVYADKYGKPYIQIDGKKEYDDGSIREFENTNSKGGADINVEFISTFDNLLSDEDNGKNKSPLDMLLDNKISFLREHLRKIKASIEKKTGQLQKAKESILENISNATTDELEKFKNLTVEENKIKDELSESINAFRHIADDFLSYTNKQIVIDSEKSILSIKTGQGVEIDVEHLSSGEKQLLIILLTCMDDKLDVLLLDEPEISLHVGWQSVLLEKILQLNPNIQIIVATHNPLIALNRLSGEIGIISSNSEEVNTSCLGTQALDVSTILLKYFGLSSLVGMDMQNKIRRHNELKLSNPTPDSDEHEELIKLADELKNSLTGEIIHDRNYLKFLEFVQKNNINLNEYDKLGDDEIDELLEDFKGFFDD